MATEKDSFKYVFTRLGSVLSYKPLYDNVCFKPKQIQCFDHILRGSDVIAVLPTGYGKSLIFQLLPWVLPKKSSKGNTVLVVCPLSSIIEDQVEKLTKKEVNAAMLPIFCDYGKTFESLFEDEKDTCFSNKSQQITQNILNGDVDILFAHPEALLSEQGRSLLKSKVFQETVVACAIDEAHCVEMWGKDFRTDFSELAVLRSLILDIKFIAVTATSTPIQVNVLAKKLCFGKNMKTVVVSPNRKNIFLSVKLRKPSCYGFESFKEILLPLAKDLSEKKLNFPITIIYMKLKYCGYGYNIFDKVLGKDQYVDKKVCPSARMFNQFHASQTNSMKSLILEELNTEKSRVRVVFATTALGMGVDAPYISHVIHISPPATMESYAQEIGRAGRSKSKAKATLYYNKNDIGDNTHVEKSMKDYCLDKGCFRKFIVGYFGFNCQKQSLCCSNCNSDECINTEIIKSRNLNKEDKEVLKNEIQLSIKKSLTKPAYPFFVNELSKDIVDKIVDDINNVDSPSDLLFKFEIIDDVCREEIFQSIAKYASYQDCTTK